jgi:hypothetical protein
MLDNFSRQAKLYAKYRPSYPDELYDFILGHLQHQQTAWDCGTGSGQVASQLADHFEHVFASDISEGQLRHAPQKPNIEYLKVPAEDSGLPENSCDLITVAQAIHWFDFDGFYAEVKRTAKKDALLAVIGYGIVQTNEQLNPLIDKFYNYAFGCYFNDNRRYVDEHYQKIPFPFEEIDTPEFSISYKWSRDELEGYFNSWSTVQKFKENDGFNPVDNFMDELNPFWKKDERKKVTFPVFLRLGRIVRFGIVE